jgi:uncharacterized membrane protein YfcA
MDGLRGSILDTVLMVMLILLITNIGGIVRLCVFSSFRIKEALPMILISDFVIGGVTLVFKVFHIEDDDLLLIICISLLLPVAIYFIYISIKRDMEEEKEEKKREKSYKY